MHHSKRPSQTTVQSLQSPVCWTRPSLTVVDRFDWLTDWFSQINTRTPVSQIYRMCVQGYHSTLRSLRDDAYSRLFEQTYHQQTTLHYMPNNVGVNTVHWDTLPLPFPVYPYPSTHSEMGLDLHLHFILNALTPCRGSWNGSFNTRSDIAVLFGSDEIWVVDKHQQTNFPLAKWYKMG